MKKIKATWDLWDNIKHANLHIIGIPEGEEREKWIENVFEEIMAENLLTWEKKQISKSRKHRESQKGSTQRGPHQDSL